MQINRLKNAVLKKKNVGALVFVLISFALSYLFVAFSYNIYQVGNPYDSTESVNLSKYGLDYSVNYSQLDDDCIDYHNVGTVRAVGIPFPHTYEGGGSKCGPISLSRTNHVFIVLDVMAASAMVYGTGRFTRKFSLKVQKRG